MTTRPNIQAAPLTARGHTRALLTLGAPLVGSHLAQIAIGATDVLMMGWYDVTGLAAISLAGPVFYLFFIMGSGFAWALMPMVASAAGTEDDRVVRRVTRMGMWLSILTGVIVTPVFIFAEPVLLAMGQLPEVAEQAGLYLMIAGLGLVPSLLVMVLKSYFSALERTRVILLVTVGAAFVNAAANYLLIFGNFGAPELGIVGAAIASIAVQIVSVLGLGIYAAKATPEYELFKNFHRPDWEAFVRVFRLGWPIGLTSLAEIALFAGSTLMMGLVGKIELAAHGIALQIGSITFMIHIGLSQAITVRAGRYHGRGDVDALRQASKVALSLSMIVVALTIAMFLLMPGVLIGAFVDPTDPDRPQILRIGTAFLAVAALFQLVDAAQVMALGMLRGVQDTRVPMLLATISYWILGIPAMYVLGIVMGFGGLGIWFGLTIGLAVAGLLLQIRFWMRFRIV